MPRCDVRKPRAVEHFDQAQLREPEQFWLPKIAQHAQRD
jgi:hypothetical protein